MNREHTGSRIFAHTRMDAIPVLAGVAHLLFDVYLIVGFNSRPLWVSVLLGCLYAVSISWNINGVSHNFIHTPYFRPRWLNHAFSLLESIAIGFSQTYYDWIHMRHHVGNSDRQDEHGETVDWISLYRHGTDGKPESVWGYTFLSVFRDNIGDVHKAIAKSSPFDARWARFELRTFLALAFAALVYNWKALLFLVPFYYLGNCLSSLNGYYEHFNGNPDVPLAWGVSSYNTLYNFLWFGNGYHAEHHYRPRMHWTNMRRFHEQIKQEQERAGVHSITTCHALGFLAKENREIAGA